MTAAPADTKFVWRGLGLRLGRRSTLVLTIVTDAIYPHLFRIKYPNGWTSTATNLTRAKDAAYGHARYLLVAETPQESPLAGETDEVAHGPPETKKPATVESVNGPLKNGRLAGATNKARPGQLVGEGEV